MKCSEILVEMNSTLPTFTRIINHFFFLNKKKVSERFREIGEIFGRTNQFRSTDFYRPQIKRKIDQKKFFFFNLKKFLLAVNLKKKRKK